MGFFRRDDDDDDQPEQAEQTEQTEQAAAPPVPTDEPTERESQPMSYDPNSLAGVPEHGRQRMAETKEIFTSDLSVDEFLLVKSAGFEPLGFVVGSSIYHIGLQLQSLIHN
jgi:hypothetical protein